MRGPRVRRHRLAALGACTTALAAGASTARAQAPEDGILGFSPDGVAAQLRDEATFRGTVSPASAASTSRALSATPQRIGTPGVRRSQAYAVALLRSYGLRPTTPSYDVYVSRPNRIQVTMRKPYFRPLAVKERGFPWQRDFEDVVVGYNA
jgi:hypothetical protein